MSDDVVDMAWVERTGKRVCLLAMAWSTLWIVVISNVFPFYWWVKVPTNAAHCLCLIAAGWSSRRWWGEKWSRER